MSVWCGIVPTLAVVLAGVVLIARPALATAAARTVRRRSVWWARWEARLTTARAQLKDTLGPAGAWVMLCGAGLAVCVAVLWPLGRVALRLEDAWDRPIFGWFRDHQAGSGWHRLNEILTQVGNRPPIYAAAVVAALVLVALAPRRRWAPPALVIVAVLLEQVVRVGLLRVVDRGHPPTSLGTWPSGGVGRIIAIYGFIAFLLFWGARRRGLRIATGRTGPHTAAALGALVAVMATVEGYTRLYLQKHWFTDVLGGYVFGCILLAVFVYAGRALLDPADSSRAAGAGEAIPSQAGAEPAPRGPDDVMSARR
jgi:PAP2 superfamily